MRAQLVFSLLFLSFPIASLCQFNFEYQDNIIVKKSGDTLINAWAGGLDYVQISDVDFDFDGDMDLFVFDRSRDNIRVFTQELINGQKKWKLFHDSYTHFPSDVIYRATMVDFDYDGRKDLFTYGIGGLKVYRNVGNAIDGIQWQLFKEIVNSDYYGFVSNLYVSSSDIPAIVDVDADGDLDILTFALGGGTVEYHKNLSQELYGHSDSLTFELKNGCWGKFSEGASTNSITLNYPFAPCNGDGNVTTPEKSSANHAGSTLLAMDYDNSGVMDLILGDVANNNLALLLNSGSLPNMNSPMVSVDFSFPSNSLPANVYLFPAPFWVDVDFDGKKDLIVGANAKNVSENETSILFYKNTGTNTLPNFNFQTKSFLQNTMIEHGKGSIPVFQDIDNDGKTDMLVANLFRYKDTGLKESTMAWYKNTGTASVPEFTFVDADFLNLSSANYGLRLVPTFGDIDGDGLDELLIGTEFGKIIKFENNGTTFVSPVVDYQDNLGNPITCGSFAFPQLFDLDNDGLLDLIIGNKTGELTYYRNIGTSTTPSFQLVTNNLGGVDVSTDTPDGYATPHFFRHGSATHLFIGSINGKLIYYTSIDDSLATGGNFELYSDNFLNLTVEGYSSFFVNDIDNDTHLNLFVGQDLGGITSLEVDPNSSASIKEKKTIEAIIYPNPTKSTITIQLINASENNHIRLFDLNGRMLMSQEIANKTQLDMSNLERGIYLLSIHDDKGSISTKRIVKE